MTGSLPACVVGIGRVSYGQSGINARLSDWTLRSAFTLANAVSRLNIAQKHLNVGGPIQTSPALQDYRRLYNAPGCRAGYIAVFALAQSHVDYRRRYSEVSSSISPRFVASR
jgi:hypothetical protein